MQKTGKELCLFNPHDEKGQGGGVSRGLSYWEDGDDKRIYMFANHRLIALNARTGKQIMSFGENGFVDLRKGLRDDKEIETDAFVIGEEVLIIDGPFSSMKAVIDEITGKKVKLNVSIFGRKTPLMLEIHQIDKKI